MTNQTHTRFAAAALVLGPLLFTTGDLLRRLVVPPDASSPTAITAAVARHGGAWTAAALLVTAAGFLLVPAAIALVVSARGRGARLITLGGGLLTAGAMAGVGHAVAFYSPYALYNRAHLDGPTIETLERHSEADPLLVALIGLFIAGMTLGPLVLFVGLRRAGRVPVWALVAAVVFVVSGGTASVGAGVIGIVAAMVAFVPAARSLTTVPSVGSPTSSSVTVPAPG